MWIGLYHQLYPEGFSVSNHQGYLTIHQACDLLPESVDVVRLVLERYPQGSRVTDMDGRLPLHHVLLAEEGTRSLELVQVLLDAFPDSPMIADVEGSLPLHHACRKGANTAILRVLLESYPQGAAVRDDDGNFPLHLFGLRPESSTDRGDDELIEVARLLIEAFSDTVRAANNTRVEATYRCITYFPGRKHFLC